MATVQIPDQFRSKALDKITRRYPPQSFLGEGCYKWVYGSGKVAVAITNDLRQLRIELEALKRLKALGIQVVKILKCVIDDACGIGILVLKRYKHIKSITNDVKKQLDYYASILRHNSLYVSDVQTMIDDNGTVVLMDPLFIRENNPSPYHGFRVDMVAAEKYYSYG